MKGWDTLINGNDGYHYSNICFSGPISAFCLLHQFSTTSFVSFDSNSGIYNSHLVENHGANRLPFGKDCVIDVDEQIVTEGPRSDRVIRDGASTTYPLANGRTDEKQSQQNKSMALVLAATLLVLCLRPS